MSDYGGLLSRYGYGEGLLADMVRSRLPQELQRPEYGGLFGLPNVLEQMQALQPSVLDKPGWSGFDPNEAYRHGIALASQSPFMGFDTGGIAGVAKRPKYAGLEAYKGAYPYDPNTGPVYAFKKDAAGTPRWQAVERAGAEPELLKEWASPSDILGGPIAGFFSNSPDVASRFANVYDQGAVFPVTIDFKKPLVIDAKGKPAAAFQFSAVAREHGTSDIMDRIREAFSEGNDKHDGLILKNTADEGTVYVPRQSAQIKSRFESRR